MTPVQLEDLIHTLADGLAPGTLIIVKLFNDLNSESIEEKREETGYDDIYDQFKIDPTPSTGGGAPQSIDAILQGPLTP